MFDFSIVLSEALMAMYFPHRTAFPVSHIYNGILAIRKNDYPTFAATWPGLEEIMLSEISQAEKDNHHMVSLTYGT